MGGLYGPAAMPPRATAPGRRRLATVLVALGALAPPAGALAQEPAPDLAVALALDEAETRLREIEGVAAGHAARLGIRPPVQPAPETLEAVASRVTELEEVVAFLAGRQELLRARPRPGASPAQAARPLRRGAPDVVAVLAERLGLDAPSFATTATPAVAAWLAGSTEVLREAELPLLWPARGRLAGQGPTRVAIAARAGSPAIAAAAGTVTIVGRRGLVIGHGEGLATAYLGLASVAVGRGDAVARGQVIGTTGAALRFQVRLDGHAADPLEHVRPPARATNAPGPPGKAALDPESPAPTGSAPDCPAGPARAARPVGFTCAPAAGGYSRKASRSSTRTPISSR